MRLFFLASVSLSLLLSLISCQKEPDFIDAPQTGGNTGGSNGGNGGGNSGGSSTGTYNPLTSGTTWKFKDTATNAITTLTVTNAKKTISNVVYTGVVGSTAAQSDTAWMAKDGANYYERAKGVSPNTGASYDFLFHYLNDTASVGYNWTYNAGQGNGFTAWIKTTIIERNISMTVGGKTYQNVIHTRLDLSYDILGSIMDFGSYDFFVAKGVGIIKVRASLSSFGVPLLQTCSDLFDYTIK